MTEAAGGGGERTRTRTPGAGRLVQALGLFGAVLLAVLVVSLGPATIAEHLRGLGAILPAVLLLTGLKYPLQTAGWRLLLPREQRPAWGAAVGATITGDALGYVTWAGPFTAEPMRALLVRDAVPVGPGLAAGVLERGVYHLTAGLIVAAVLLLAFPSRYGAAVLVIVGVLSGLLVIRAAKRRPVRPSSAPVPPPARPTGRDGHVEAFKGTLRELSRTRRSALGGLVLLCLGQHAVLVGEAYLMLGVLSAGATTLWAALEFEAMTKLVNTAGLLVPARLGVAEGGTALLAESMGFAASQGVSLALMRRVRALIWAAVGLALLPLWRWWQRRRGPTG